MKRVLFACALAAASTIVTLAACKQGKGERCQVNDDCDDGLTCNQAKNTCESMGAGTADVDAASIDAVPDSPPADAAIDAP